MTKHVCARLATLVALVCLTAAACGSEPPLGRLDRIAPGAGFNSGSDSGSGSTGATVPSISGEVRDTTFRPIAGARIDVLDGPRAGLSATTDGTGRYLLNGPFHSSTHVRATRDGYEGITNTFTCLDSSCFYYIISPLYP